MLLFSSIGLETISGKKLNIQSLVTPIHYCIKLQTSTDNEYESGFIRKQQKSDNKLKNDHLVAQIGYLYMMVDMKNIIINDLEKNIYGTGIQLKLRRNND